MEWDFDGLWTPSWTVIRASRCPSRPTVDVDEGFEGQAFWRDVADDWHGR